MDVGLSLMLSTITNCIKQCSVQYARGRKVILLKVPQNLKTDNIMAVEIDIHLRSIDLRDLSLYKSLPWGIVQTLYSLSIGQIPLVI